MISKEDTVKNFLIDNINFNDINLTFEDLEKYFQDNQLIKRCFSKAKRISIGTAILVKNQKSKIKKAILDAKTISDEIVVCDTGSTDGTIEVLEKLSLELPLKIKNCLWEEDYAKMRNKASSFLDTDWIFIIDSDESLESTININLLKFLLCFLEEILINKDIVLCFRQKASDIKATGYPQRLYKNNQNLFFWGYVHEELRSPNIINIDTKFTLFNQGTDKLEMKKFNKEERYNQLLLKNIEKEPENPKWVSLLSTDWILKNLDKSYPMITRLIDQIKKRNDSPDYYDLTLFTLYIVILMGTNTNSIDILKEIQFAKVAFSNNPIFLYYEHSIKLAEIDKLVIDQINQLRLETETLKNEPDSYTDWNIYYPIENLECIMIKLLMKCEKYSIAYDMFFRNRQELVKTHLIETEINFFENINNNSPSD